MKATKKCHAMYVNVYIRHMYNIHIDNVNTAVYYIWLYMYIKRCNYICEYIYTRLYTNTPKCWNKNRSHAKGIHPRNVNGMSHFLDHGGVVTLGVPKKTHECLQVAPPAFHWVSWVFFWNINRHDWAPCYPIHGFLVTEMQWLNQGAHIFVLSRTGKTGHASQDVHNLR